MSLKFFLKLYSRLMVLVTFVVLLCGVLVWGVNQVRFTAWQEDFPRPLLTWLASVPGPAGQYPWLTPLYDFRNARPALLELDPVQRERLGYGQVVLAPETLGSRLLWQRDPERVMAIRFRDLYRDVAEATGLVVSGHLDTAPAEDRPELMTQLSRRLAVDLQPLSASAMLPSQAVLERVADRGLAFWQPHSGAGAEVLLRLRDGTLVQMAMPPPFNAWPWSVIALMLATGALVLAVALKFLLRDADRNLRAVESVAVRIARGELEARVEPGDSTLVSRLAGSINGMAEQIQRLVSVQREMIHAVSHELRTPVARIRFGVQMLEGNHSEEALRRQLDGIDGDIQELDELIDEILTYARLEQGGPVFSLQEASVTEIVRQVAQEQQIIHSGVDIDAEVPETAEYWQMSDVEPRYLHRAVQNLVGNAARYARGRVRVSCHLDDETCRIDVEDDGPGIPESDWEKVFTAFARLDDSRTRTSGGYGLGLSIVRRILFWHGGQSFVGRSDELGGARFSLVWPRRSTERVINSP